MGSTFSLSRTASPNLSSVSPPRILPEPSCLHLEFKTPLSLPTAPSRPSTPCSDYPTRLSLSYSLWGFRSANNRNDASCFDARPLDNGGIPVQAHSDVAISKVQDISFLFGSSRRRCIGERPQHLLVHGSDPLVRGI